MDITVEYAIDAYERVQRAERSLERAQENLQKSLRGLSDDQLAAYAKATSVD